MSRLPLIPVTAAALMLAGCTAGPLKDSPDPIDDQPPASIDAIPALFLGTWDANAESCGWESSNGRVLIERQTLTYYESVARVQTIQQPQPNAIRLDLAFTGEGQTWDKTLTLALSPSGNELTFKDPGIARYTLTRCRR
ncbi:hypothetical protein SAMN05661010_01390 [Modicisalibacter muralis]|uniref:Protease inhibitor Inh n=1 Tax=Modicisalibacter muralis TaxID=119000 RepID=A0A1G9IZC6_9GAMM|nr:hypothetical protein [Halomonas muralis]SDL30293.1 hypothetical protein SAMN05661010_01390 [Halomonas muralis]